MDLTEDHLHLLTKRWVQQLVFMINWKLSKAELWTTQTLPHGTQLKSEFSKWNKTHYSWMLGMSPLLPDYSISAVIPSLTLHAKWILLRMETLKIDHLHGQNKPYFLSLFVLIFVFIPLYSLIPPSPFFLLLSYFQPGYARKFPVKSNTMPLTGCPTQ